MNRVLTLTRKDLQLLFLDKTSVIVTFALPLVLVAIFGGAFSGMFPPSMGITSYDYIFSKVMFWGLIGAVATSVGLIAIEKNSGTIVRLQLSPITKTDLMLSKSLACITMMMLSSLLSLVFCKLFFGIKVNSYIFLILTFLSNAIFFAGLMTFLANFVKTERAAGALSWSVLQVLACFSGIMFPVTIMPPWMMTISNLDPVTWAVKAMEIALWKDITFDTLLLPIGIPVVAGIVLFCASSVMFRWTTSDN